MKKIKHHLNKRIFSVTASKIGDTKRLAIAEGPRDACRPTVFEI